MHQQVLKSDLDRYHGSIMDCYQQVRAAFQFVIQNCLRKGTSEGSGEDILEC